jgi:hypothetical protein
MLSFDQVGDLLDELAGEFPQEFYTELNGGISLLPEAKLNEEAGPDLYILGEYCQDAMGRYINIYYASFAALYGDLSDGELEDELYATLSHEFTHHMESMAGERGLEIRDEEYLEQLREESEP